MSNVAFDTWIKPIEPVGLENTEIKLRIPGGRQKGSLSRSLIMTKYRSLIESSLKNVTGRNLDLNICLEAGDEPNDDPTMHENTLNLRYTFENFIVGNNNNLAQAASLAVAENPGNKYNPLFIYGGSGLGKTHLLQAIGNHFVKHNPDKRVLYTTSEKFTYELVGAIREKTNQDFRNKHRTVDLLLMDDVQFLATKELAQEEFFHTFNTLYEAGKQIVLTSDRLPSETPHLTDRLKGRFQMGLLADIQPPDYETRLAILKSKIEDEYFTFDEEIVEYVANNITSNVRDLEGALKRILAYAGIERTNTISMELAQKALKEILSTLPQRNITISTIIDEVEKYYRLPKGSLITKKRSNDIAYPRHIAMYISRVILDESYSKIGDEFRRDHSTVMNAVKKIKKMVTEDPELQEILDELVANIKRD
ncbi:MAG TPA: chromosomal replication initiator protein DnaA [Candidatus Monoglobus merdigallinarum]|uniref:Chromosomal replication initiator protein DnaA n=1 Tax=Candidatus Monoglobus merdigallinarum TaxID=2838698 RepID=A0A9D1PQT4_9FIRM|nr:chromosomal replication initiator protein DnaA [Candidatus Monoglobus merdigallinarum]